MNEMIEHIEERRRAVARAQFRSHWANRIAFGVGAITIFLLALDALMALGVIK